MAKAALSNQFRVGIAGLDSSGLALARVLAENSVSVVVCHPEHTKILRDEFRGTSVHVVASVKDMVKPLSSPRAVVLGGADVSGEIFRDLLTQLEASDLLIDAGHAYFKDCQQRASLLAGRGIRHLDLGIIGAPPVLLAGGRQEIYLTATPLLESMAARRDGAPLASHVGTGAAGRFVQMIHDGIEYALAQLAQETFSLARHELDLGEPEWREATTGWPWAAHQTGLPDDAARWTSQTSRELGVPTPTIDAAVGMRILSDFERQNDFATTPFRQPMGRFRDDPESVLEELHGALHAATIITYAQGLAALTTGAQQYGFGIDVMEVLGLWKECRGQRAALLDGMTVAYESIPGLQNLLLDDELSEMVMDQQERLRHAIWRAGPVHISIPTLAASLDYLDSFRGAWLPINLISTTPPRLADLVHH